MIKLVHKSLRLKEKSKFLHKFYKKHQVVLKIFWKLNNNKKQVCITNIIINKDI